VARAEEKRRQNPLKLWMISNVRPLVYQVKYYDHPFIPNSYVVPSTVGGGVVPPSVPSTVRNGNQIDKVGQQQQQVVGVGGVDLRVEGVQHPHSFHHPQQQQQQPQRVFYYGVGGQEGVPFVQQVVQQQPQPQQQGFLYVNPIIPPQQQQQQQNYYAAVSVPCPLDYQHQQQYYQPHVVPAGAGGEKVVKPGVVQPHVQDKYRKQQQQQVYSSGVGYGGVPDYYPYYQPYYYYYSEPQQQQQYYRPPYNPYNYVVSQSVQNQQSVVVPQSNVQQNKEVVKEVVKKDQQQN